MIRLSVHPVTRALFVVGAVAVLATGATLAAFTTQTTLAATSISSVTASLKIRNTNNTWGSSAPGFKIKNLLPGTGVSENIYFKNAGSVSLNLTAHVPRAPVNAPGGNGFTGWNNLLVSITGTNCGATIQTTMAALLGGTPIPLPCGALAAGASGTGTPASHVGNYVLHFDIVQSAINGSHAGVGSFDLQFTGTQS